MASDSVLLLLGLIAKKVYILVVWANFQICRKLGWSRMKLSGQYFLGVSRNSHIVQVMHKYVLKKSSNKDQVYDKPW